MDDYLALTDQENREPIFPTLQIGFITSGRSTFDVVAPAH